MIDRTPLRLMAVDRAVAAEPFTFNAWLHAAVLSGGARPRSPQYHSQAVRRVELHGFQTNQFIGGAPRPPFWRRRMPWIEAALFLLLIAALVAAILVSGGRFEV